MASQRADAASPRVSSARPWNLSRLVTSYSLLILIVLLTVFFSLLLPRTFPTAFNIRSILGTQSVIALLALAVMTPLAAGQYDLSVGFVLGITEMFVIGLQTNSHLGWPLAVLLAIALGGAIGLINGLLVTARQDRFLHRDAGLRAPSRLESPTGTAMASRSPASCRIRLRISQIFRSPVTCPCRPSSCSSSRRSCTLSWNISRSGGGCMRSAPTHAWPNWSEFTPRNISSAASSSRACCRASPA